MNEKHISKQESNALKNKISKREETRFKNEREKLEEAKAKCPPDKERFSIDEFQKIYDLTNDKGISIITPETIIKLEIQYYITYGNMKSMREFAKYREYLDGHNVG